jgi:hypothetical protein
MAQPNPAAVINVPAGQNIQQILQNHDRAKRSTDIPLFYGNAAKDTIAAHLLIIRVHDAGETQAGTMLASSWSSKCASETRPSDGLKVLPKTA